MALTARHGITDAKYKVTIKTCDYCFICFEFGSLNEKVMTKKRSKDCFQPMTPQDFLDSACVNVES